MAVNIRQPWQANPVQYVQAPVAQPRQSGPLGELGAQLAGTAAENAIGLGANSLAQSGTGLGQFAGSLLGGSGTGTTLGSALGLGGAGGAGASALGGLGAGLAAAAPVVAPLLGIAALGKVFGAFQDGTTDVDYGPDPLGLEDGTTSAKVSKLYKEGYTAPGQAYAIAKSMGYRDGGYAGWQDYAAGTDTVPAMLTENEAVIPAPAAQDPMNKPVIQGMVAQGRAMNDGIPAPSPMMGPLSGKTKREEMKLQQDMQLKERSWMADEKRKQEAHEQKMKMDKMKGVLALKQTQE